MRVLENHRIQDKIESATDVASELRHTAWIATRHREECEGRANSMHVLDNATTDGNVLVYVKLSKKGECEIEDDEEHQVSAVSKMAGDEWKKSSDQAKEPCQKKYEAAKAQNDRDPAGEGHRSAVEGNAATDRAQEGKDKDAPKRPACGVYSQLLAEKWEEIKKSLPADHKITDVIKAEISPCR